MSRRMARQMALQTLFQLEFSSLEVEDAFLAVKQEQQERFSERSIFYADNLIKGVLRNKGDIDRNISSCTKDWDIKRLNKVDLIVLRVAIYEMYFSAERIMPNIAINEAVEIAKLYGDDDSPKFINGILGKIVKNMDKEDGISNVSGH